MIKFLKVPQVKFCTGFVIAGDFPRLAFGLPAYHCWNINIADNSFLDLLWDNLPTMLYAGVVTDGINIFELVHGEGYEREYELYGQRADTLKPTLANGKCRLDL
jgi:hypothetical protein